MSKFVILWKTGCPNVKLLILSACVLQIKLGFHFNIAQDISKRHPKVLLDDTVYSWQFIRNVWALCLPVCSPVFILARGHCERSRKTIILSIFVFACWQVFAMFQLMFYKGILWCSDHRPGLFQSSGKRDAPMELYKALWNNITTVCIHMNTCIDHVTCLQLQWPLEYQGDFPPGESVYFCMHVQLLFFEEISIDFVIVFFFV